MSHSFALLVPVKTLSLAKSRLSVEPEQSRAALMRAFALDAISAATRSPVVVEVHVVTNEAGFERGFEGGFVHRLADEGAGDLNRALVSAARQVRLRDPQLAVAALCADLPCLRPEELTEALRAGLTSRWFVADAAGTGTTLLAAAPRTDLDPHFGIGSARRHQESGAVPVRAAVPTVRRDVDTGADLAAARELGIGRHTARMLRGLSAPHPEPGSS